ncbi:unnamed protein product [Chondrus crispus]|uniref:Uncharacterized protein n=1 Tax=Chondrus crispus TaxID=2769 RepID=R7Q6B9_CHOCR|nr:unnamed protein product [Chondrus crispus]CDF32936.1 unnamed protein product [Chondrus crispus]|eukprot:XP_005712739.1 unnamed protein product [Chondrus crispus]
MASSLDGAISFGSSVPRRCTQHHGRSPPRSPYIGNLRSVYPHPVTASAHKARRPLIASLRNGRPDYRSLHLASTGI